MDENGRKFFRRTTVLCEKREKSGKRVSGSIGLQDFVIVAVRACFFVCGWKQNFINFQIRKLSKKSASFLPRRNSIVMYEQRRGPKQPPRTFYSPKSFHLPIRSWNFYHPQQHDSFVRKIGGEMPERVIVHISETNHVDRRVTMTLRFFCRSQIPIKKVILIGSNVIPRTDVMNSTHADW